MQNNQITVTVIGNNEEEAPYRDEVISETRKRTFEKKVIKARHGTHGFFCEKGHMYFDIFHITYSEHRTVTIDSKGQNVYTDWRKIPGSEETTFIFSGVEGGWTYCYEREI